MKGEMFTTTRVSWRVPVGSSVERKGEESVTLPLVVAPNVGNDSSIHPLWRYMLNIPKAHKRLKSILQFFPVLVVLAAVTVAPVFTPPHEVSVGGFYLAGKCYVGSCTLDELFG